ncbi:MAG: hypothetical protein GYA46_11175 [candidate division Zixibacteria bacterium]|nr:hypothetical protein [candidate division Zixibacteria bacterium]
MKRHAFFIQAIIVFMAVALLVFLGPVYGQEEKAAPAATLTGEAVIAKYIEAVGGQPALDKITNRYMKAKLTIVGAGLSMDVAVYTARPNKSYTQMSSAAIGNTERGYDGEIFWEKSTAMGARILEGGELADAIRESAFDQVADWRQFFDKAELTGSDTTAGVLCHTVVVTPKIGKPQTWYFDQKTALLRKISTTVEHQMGAIPVTSTIDDYRAVDGILIPFRMTQSAMGQNMSMAIDTIAQNIELPPDVFKVPDDVKALIKK